MFFPVFGVFVCLFSLSGWSLFWFAVSPVRPRENSSVHNSVERWSQGNTDAGVEKQNREKAANKKWACKAFYHCRNLNIIHPSGEPWLGHGEVSMKWVSFPRVKKLSYLPTKSSSIIGERLLLGSLILKGIQGLPSIWVRCVPSVRQAKSHRCSLQAAFGVLEWGPRWYGESRHLCHRQHLLSCIAFCYLEIGLWRYSVCPCLVVLLRLRFA